MARPGVSSLPAMEILTTRLHPDAVVPLYANDGDAGCDLVAVESCTLKARGGRALVATGLAVAIPEGHGGFVLPRSGLASRHGVTCANAPGLIDPGYRGEIGVVMFNLGSAEYVVEKGDRIAQLVIAKYEAVEWEEGDELGDSKRGAGGFGSSGR